MKISIIRPEFVEFVPKELEEGILYICEQYNTASHKCACGCGEKVVTPLSPADWQVRKEGKLISMHPSIGNWDYACQSHYFISKNKIRWARQYSAHEIERVKQRDRIAKAHHIDDVNRLKDLRALRPEEIGDKTSSGLQLNIWKWVTDLIHRFFNR